MLQIIASHPQQITKQPTRQNIITYVTMKTIDAEIIRRFRRPTAHMFAGPLSPREAKQLNISANARNGALSQIDCLTSFCRFEISTCIKFALLVQKLLQLLMNLCLDYFALQHLKNCNLTSESHRISTRLPQTPDKGIYMDTKLKVTCKHTGSF